MDTFKKVTGTWRGLYAYEPSDKLPMRDPVPFTLILKQRWFGRFSGTVTDDAILGMPGTGVIDGYISYPRVEFYKRMPVCYVARADGRKVSLRDYLIEQGYTCDHDIPHQPIFYRGEFSDPRHAQGAWIIAAGSIPLGGGRVIKMAETKGTWMIEAQNA